MIEMKQNQIPASQAHPPFRLFFPLPGGQNQNYDNDIAHFDSSRTAI